MDFKDAAKALELGNKSMLNKWAKEQGIPPDVLNAILVRLDPESKKRGRPKGARTSSKTPAVERAEAYWELVISGTKPTQAAKEIAEKFDSDTNRVFKDAKRHFNRIADELDIRVAAHRAALEMGPRRPNDPEIFVNWVLKNALMGYSI